MAKKNRMKGKTNQATTRELMAFALLSAAGAAAVSGLALAGRSQAGGVFGVLLLAVSVIGALYAAMWLGGAAIFLFLDQLSNEPERAVNWYWRLAWAVAFLSLPLSSYLLGFDRDQWIWGTGSTVVGLGILLFVLYGRHPRKNA